MPLDFSVIDAELQKQGVDPERVGRLLNFSRAMNAAPGSATPAQPGTRDYNLRLAATNQPRVNFAGPRPDPRSIATPPALETTPPIVPQQGGSRLNFGMSRPVRPHEVVASSEDVARQAQAMDSAENRDTALLPSASRLNFASAASRPRTPAALTSEPTQPGVSENKFSPESGVTGGEPARPASFGMNAASMLRAAGGGQQRPIEDEYRDLLRSEPAREQFPVQPMSKWKKLLGVAASIAAGVGGGGNVAGETARSFFGRPERKAEEKFEQAHQTWEGKVGNLMRSAKFRQEDLQDRNLQSEIDTRNRPRTEKPENLDREAYDYYVGKGMTPAQARQRVLQDAQDVKPDRQTRTSPFEAFAYGDPQEKQAAQDFLDLEHKLNSKYRTENEFQEKYRLFKEDPETYKAMFGDKSADKPDRATATKMLNYFDRRRREVNADFTLDDQQKQQQLQDIENLEKPFLDAVQPGGEDRVQVMHSDGRRGTVPRSQLEKAKKKGYREVPAQ